MHSFYCHVIKRSNYLSNFDVIRINGTFAKPLSIATISPYPYHPCASAANEFAMIQINSIDASNAQWNILL